MQFLIEPLFFLGCYTLAGELAVSAFAVARLFAHGFSAYLVLAGFADTTFQSRGWFGAYHASLGRFSHTYLSSSGSPVSIDYFYLLGMFKDNF